MCQEDRAVERVPDKSGLGHAGMLTSMGFAFHEYSSYSGIHPCGVERDQACWWCTSGIWSFLLTGID